MTKICVVYSHHKLGDLIWQLPYIKSISDFHQSPIFLVTREKTQAKKILQDENYIFSIFYNNFRKKIWYFYEIYLLYKFFKKKNFSHIYFLDKINRPAIAAWLANIKNRIGLGVKNQKKWLTNKFFLDEKDYLLNYSLQSKKFLEINGIAISNFIPQINIKASSLTHTAPNLKKYKNEICVSFGVDSFEEYKIWYEENFAKLSEMLLENKIATFFYLICGPDKAHIAKKIMSLACHNKFLDCSDLDLLGVIKVLKDSAFFVGNNSGPLNLSSSLGIKTFGLISGSSVDQLKFTNIIPIVPENYIDQFVKDRREMKKITINRAYQIIIKNI